MYLVLFFVLLCACFPCAFNVNVQSFRGGPYDHKGITYPSPPARTYLEFVPSKRGSKILFTRGSTAHSFMRGLTALFTARPRTPADLCAGGWYLYVLHFILSYFYLQIKVLTFSASCPEVSERMRGTISSASANFLMAYWSSPVCFARRRPGIIQQCSRNRFPNAGGFRFQAHQFQTIWWVRRQRGFHSEV